MLQRNKLRHGTLSNIGNNKIVGFRLLFYYEANLNTISDNNFCNSELKKRHPDLYKTFDDIGNKYENNLSKKYQVEIICMPILRGADFERQYQPNGQFTFDDFYPELNQVKNQFGKTPPFILLSMSPGHPENETGKEKVLTALDGNSSFEKLDNLLESIIDVEEWEEGKFKEIEEYGTGDGCPSWIKWLGLEIICKGKPYLKYWWVPVLAIGANKAYKIKKSNDLFRAVKSKKNE